MSQYNSVSKHLCGALDCLYDEWSENSCEITCWSAGVTLEEIVSKIQKLNGLLEKLQIIHKAGTVLCTALCGEPEDDRQSLKKTLSEIENSLYRDLSTSIEMLEAFAERTRAKNKSDYLNS